MSRQIDIINNLKNNFLFQASLGSKELFHSNILAWLLEQETKDGEFSVLKSFIYQFSEIEATDLKRKEDFKIAREQNKIDLTVRWRKDKDWNFIFIENKMKSTPTLKQLKEYDQKILKLSKSKNNPTNKVIKKLLLTPFPDKIIIVSDISKGDAKEVNWENISYADNILPFLDKIVVYNFKNDDVKFVIERYINFLKDQNALLDTLSLGSDINSFKDRKYDFYLSGEMDKVRDLRLHDLVLKLAHSRIEQLLRASFQIEDIEINRFETAFTNSTGISSVDIKISENIFIGIQLQGNQFRYYITTNDSDCIELNEKLSVKLFKEELWFHDIDTNEPLKGRGHRKDIYKKHELRDDNGFRSFCEYNKGGFIYLYKELNMENELPTINQIVDLFVRSLKHYDLHREQISQILKQLNK